MNISNILNAIENEVLNDHFIKWNGDNLLDVYSFSSINPKAYENWFSTWDEYEKYVANHNGIYKLFTLTGHYEIPVGSWLVKTPDGCVYPVGPGVKYVTELDSLLKNLEKDCPPVIEDDEVEIPITTYYPEDIYENEVVCEGNSISLRRKLDENGKPILKKRKKEWKNELGKFMK